VAPAEVAAEKRQRARHLHVVIVPAMRLTGFIALLVLVYLHNRYVLGSFSRGSYLALAGALLAWALLGWLLLYLLYGRLGNGLAFSLLLGDIAMFALVVYASGGEKSWLFFILVVRSADVAFLSGRQLLLFAHASAFAYVALLVWLAGVEGRTLEWPAEAVKAAALWAICVYLALTGRVVETLRRQTAAAMRTARGLARRLEEAWRRAEMLSAAKSRFLASMGHGLRTPLHAIIGGVHLVRDTSLSTDQQRYFTAIGISAQSLLSTVDQILDFFRVEAGKVDLEHRVFRVREALAPVVQTLAIGAEACGLDLACHVDDDVPDELVGDVERVRQVLVNLIDNGLKFTEGGGVTVRVLVAARHPDRVSLTFAVTDTGIGIRPEDQNLIFEAFARAPVSAARSKSGTGLGLAIASELVRRLGGQLRVESEPGRGSTFHFTIDFAFGPAEPSDEASAMGQPARLAGERQVANGALRDDVRPEGQRGRLRVLLVEDDPVSAEVTREALARRGYAVVVAKTGRAASEAFDRAGFDAVLVDVQLPDVDGLALAIAFRNRTPHGVAHTAIVALTAGATPGERERSLAAGVDAYLAKPVDPRTLMATLEALPRAVADPSSTPPELTPDAESGIGRLFLAEAPRQLEDVGRAMAGHDRAALAFTAHRLKGAIANLPASAALEAAERLEAFADRGEAAWEAMEAEFDRLTAALADLLEKIRQAR
jgi:signal transduction histidine kinase/DNA-binding response OmpR family regulator